MGYTHYWYQKKDIPLVKWAKIRKEIEKIVYNGPLLRQHGISLEHDNDGPDEPPKVTDAMILFDGRGEQGHETFLFSRQKPETSRTTSTRGDEESFGFCKTAMKPYDLVVCLCLLSLTRHAPDCVRIGSDGNWDEEWLEARKTYKQLFGVNSEPKGLAQVAKA
jgi:hypothetical protein